MEILNDFSTSVVKAFDEIDENWRNYQGLVIAGTHSPHDVEMMIDKIKEARENGTPTLGICFGLNLILVEFARNVLRMKEANTLEVNKNTSYPIFVKLPQLRVGIREVNGRQESHWHNYFFNNKYRKLFEENGWKFIFSDDIMEIADYDKINNYKGCQFHPEYSSSFNNPHPILLNFLINAKK